MILATIFSILCLVYVLVAVFYTSWKLVEALMNRVLDWWDEIRS